MMEIPVRDLVSDDYVTAHQSDSKSDVVNRMITHGVGESYLLDGLAVLGKLTLHELLQQPDDIALTEASDDNAKSIKHDASLMQAIEIAVPLSENLFRSLFVIQGKC